MAPRRKSPCKKNRNRNRDRGKVDFDLINETVTDEHLSYVRDGDFDPRPLVLLTPPDNEPSTSTADTTDAVGSSSSAAAGSENVATSSSHTASASEIVAASSSRATPARATVAASSSRAAPGRATAARGRYVVPGRTTANASESFVVPDSASGGVRGAYVPACNLPATFNGLAATADSSTATPGQFTSNPRHSQPQCQCTAHKHGSSECRGARPKRDSAVRSRAEVESSVSTERVARSRYNGARPSTSRELRPPPLDTCSFSNDNVKNPRRSAPLHISPTPQPRQQFQITSTEGDEEDSSSSSVQMAPDESSSDSETASTNSRPKVVRNFDHTTGNTGWMSAPDVEQGRIMRKRNNRAMTYNGSWPPMSLADLEAQLKGERLFYRPGTAAPTPSTSYGGPVPQSRGCGSARSCKQEYEADSSRQDCRCGNCCGNRCGSCCGSRCNNGCGSRCGNRCCPQEHNARPSRQGRGCCGRRCGHHHDDGCDNK